MSNFENPFGSAPQAEKPDADSGEKKMVFRKKANLFVTGAVGLGVLLGGLVSGPKAETPGANGEKDKTTQVPPAKNSHERPGVQSIGFSQAPAPEEEKLDMDALMKPESLAAGHSVKIKGPNTEGLLPDQDVQNQGKRFETAQGGNAEVDKKFNQWKKNNVKKGNPMVSFYNENK